MHNYHSTSYISNEEYDRILTFLYGIKSSRSGDIRLSILQHINAFFGYAGSSFWTVNDDYSLSDPVGVNIDRDLLERYINTYHKYDALNPQKLGFSVFNNTVIDCDRFIKQDPGNPYLASLHDYAIYHSHSLQLKVNSKITASIALFRPLQEEQRPRNALSTRCLELVAPFISQEFEIRTSLDETVRMESVLRTALNMENTGVILFDKSCGNRVLYYNPVCTNYCLDFFPQANSVGCTVQHFVNSVIVPYDSPFPGLSDLTVKLKSLRGAYYRIRIVESMEEDDDFLYTAYITPLHTDHAIIEDNSFQNLYSVLMPKEREVTLMVTQGLTNQQIADRMFISLSTVKAHM